MKLKRILMGGGGVVEERGLEGEGEGGGEAACANFCLAFFAWWR